MDGKPKPPPPRSQKLQNEPVRVIEYPNFLTQEECHHFIELGKETGMKPALLVGKTNGVDIQDEARTNTSAWLKQVWRSTRGANIDECAGATADVGVAHRSPDSALPGQVCQMR